MTEMPLTALAQDAAAAADAAARASGVVIRDLHEVSELRLVFDLYGRIWHADPTDPPITTPLLRALTHAGNYLAGAFQGDRMVGACVGFFAAPVGSALHSHMAGVAPEARGRSVGFALKAHQRAWALARGLTTVTWTFDPLVARNAYLNLARLGATPTEYVRDFYGTMDDQINAGDLTDRLVVAWQLDTPRVTRCCLGEHDEPDVDALRSAGAVVGLDARDDRPRPVPVDAPAGTLLVRVPVDIERLRAEQPSLALEWRRALRDVLGGLIEKGSRVTSFVQPGWYVVETAPVRRASGTRSHPEEAPRR